MQDRGRLEVRRCRRVLQPSPADTCAAVPPHRSTGRVPRPVDIPPMCVRSCTRARQTRTEYNALLWSLAIDSGLDQPDAAYNPGRRRAGPRAGPRSSPIADAAEARTCQDCAHSPSGSARTAQSRCDTAVSRRSQAPSCDGRQSSEWRLMGRARMVRRDAYGVWGHTVLLRTLSTRSSARHTTSASREGGPRHTSRRRRALRAARDGGV
jgi:hypothetical protein